MFFTPRYVKEARHLAEAARRVLRYRLDLLPEERIAEVEARIAELERAAKSRNRDAVRAASAALDKTVGRVAPPRSHPGWRENCEVILVAIVIAAGVRAYLLEPFKIPTGSMQPTLNGVIGYPDAAPPPNPLVRAFDFVVRGRTYLDVKAPQDDVIVGLQEFTKLNYFTYTVVQGQRSRFTVFAPAAVVTSTFRLVPGREVRAGESVVRGHVDNGDFVLVNKMAYHFFPPAHGDVFVWRTTGIRLIEKDIPSHLGSQHYIKRLVGLPGDVLQIDQPDLTIDGKPPTAPGILRVMSLKNGYRGYANFAGFNYLTEPGETFTVPPKTYFALGDNSFNSSDSRFFGPVPERNVTGKAFLAFWPFTDHWGFIN